MTESIQIYGHDIELDEVPDDGIITDIVILYRVVNPQAQSDGVGLIPSENTTGLVQSGMLTIAAERDKRKWVADID